MQSKKHMLVATTIALGILAVGGFGLRAWAEQEKEDDDVRIALPAAQVIAAIQTAVAAKPGNVLGIEAEKEDGKTLCEVTVAAKDGKTYDVDVDVSTKKVVEIEDAGAEDKEDEKDDDK